MSDQFVTQILDAYDLCYRHLMSKSVYELIGKRIAIMIHLNTSYAMYELNLSKLEVENEWSPLLTSVFQGGLFRVHRFMMGCSPTRAGSRVDAHGFVWQLML